MKEFVTAALPWVLMGLCVAFWAVRRQKEKTAANAANDTENAENAEKKPAGSYSTEGMLLGVAIGIVLSKCLDLNLGLCLAIGMCVGLGGGTGVKKKKS